MADLGGVGKLLFAGAAIIALIALWPVLPLSVRGILAWLLAVGGLAWVTRTFAGIDPLFVVLLAVGLSYGALTVVRPAWFWEHPLAQISRRLLGEAGTVLFYAALSVGLVAVGAVGIVSQLAGR
jgi:hypothetical protein